MAEGDEARLVGSNTNNGSPLHQLMAATLLAAQKDADLPRHCAHCYEGTSHPSMRAEGGQASLHARLRIWSSQMHMVQQNQCRTYLQLQAMSGDHVKLQVCTQSLVFRQEAQVTCLV